MTRLLDGEQCVSRIDPIGGDRQFRASGCLQHPEGQDAPGTRGLAVAGEHDVGLECLDGSYQFGGWPCMQSQRILDDKSPRVPHRPNPRSLITPRLLP